MNNKEHFGSPNIADEFCECLDCEAYFLNKTIKRLKKDGRWPYND